MIAPPHPAARPRIRAAVLLLTCLGAAGPTRELWAENAIRVVYQQGDSRGESTGAVFAEDRSGGVCLLQEDGELLLLSADEVVERADVAEPFQPLTEEQLTERLQEELGERFAFYTTPHYVVAYDTSRAYAKWLSSLLERLHKAFVNYWQNEGLELEEPKFPLVVVVYADQASYRRASAEELGGASGIIGYYSLTTNRVSMHDLTGTETRRNANDRTSLREINRMVSRPEVAPMVATIVHEATHQVAFNTGMMSRFADLPLWLVEGMAIYFEAPDLSSGRGWRGIGKVNRPRLQEFQRGARGWDSERLRALVTSDQRLRDPNTAASAYAEAWALNYFLIKQRPDAYRSYLKYLAGLAPFGELPENQRIRDFEEYFGPIDDLSRDFFRAILRVD
ncbi:hypothetical protein Pla123a_46100 [Posidoniimonas polymericola]|uniref:DUF1570 domain-containing protein n=1 Tax=Posidoniimonas polymericola TaxID=2528002 RepID=A0A5C5XWN3_9BACT|nr:DUF1570 domain-containing protein [Posidoniimonas polymericola]TWT66723.1 hypothetical protein Pla123a_46100 [Posidoniimonas polymericola]